jgi:hypothetical protein
MTPLPGAIARRSVSGKGDEMEQTSFRWELVLFDGEFMRASLVFPTKHEALEAEKQWTNITNYSLNRIDKNDALVEKQHLFPATNA